MKKDFSVFTLVISFIGIPIFGNILTACWAFLSAPLFFTFEISKRYTGILSEKYYFINIIIVFIIFAFLILQYLFPVIRELAKCKHPNELTADSKKRIINAPFRIASIVLVSWIVAGFSGDIIVFYVEKFLQEEAIKYLILGFLYSLLNGFFGFVFFFYLLEYLNRKIFIPTSFQNTNLFKIDGIFILSVKRRFTILLFAIGLFPSVLLFLGMHRIYENLSIQDSKAVYQSTTLIFVYTIVLSWFIIVFMGRFFKEPLEEMRNAALSIGKGDFEVRVNITSSDDLGLLGETINKMAKELKEKEIIKDTFGKMVEPEVRDYLLERNLRLGGEICNITILFSDLRGFTTLSEKLDPAEVVNLLNRYFERMNNCIKAEKGLINKFIGDAILAVFGAPISVSDHSERAIRSALAMQGELEKLNIENNALKLPELKMGIGIHSGEVLAGNIGTVNRMEYTVIGDTVNLASRLESLCKEYKKELLISETTILNCKTDFSTEFVDKVIVKGKTVPIQVFTIARV